MDVDDSDHSRASTPEQSVRDVAIRIFVQKYSFHLLAGAVEWLEELTERFDIPPSDAGETFEHLALGCRNSAGSSSPPSSIELTGDSQLT